MAMNFIGANRAEPAPLFEAALAQQRQAALLRQQEQARRQAYGAAGIQFANMVPEGQWGAAGQALMGNGGGAATAADAGLSSSLVDPISGAVASGLPEAAGASELLGAGAMQSGAATGLGAAEAATTMAAAPEAAAAAASSGGIGPALAAMGPAGWATLLAFGLGATDLFN
jgi:hypothetical protein